MKEYMQRMGRSLMLPVATLPVAGLLMGIGYMIDPNGWGGDNLIAAYLLKAGGTILDNLGILFAVGLAIGMPKKKDGASAMAGLVAFLTPLSLINTNSVAMFTKVAPEKVDVAFSYINNKNVFVGILAGLVAAALYDRFCEVKLPMALSFFSGKRLVPIVTVLSMSIISLGLLFIWPTIYNALTAFGKSIISLGAVGAGLFGFANRMLIPTGLHHALNNVFWFDLAGINDIGNFWSSTGTKGQTGMYMAGFFPIMMFGLPAGAYAIYKNSRPEKKAATGSLMMAAAVASFFTGVTEPLEFSFMFVAWPLYVVHAVLTGISMFISAFFHWTAGFNFSAGLVDFVLSLRVPIANKPYMLILQGLVFAVIYYVVFTFMIKKFNLLTPGREEGVGEETPDVDDPAEDKFVAMARKIYTALGGKENVDTIDNCTTRLRLQVKDTNNVDQAKIKATGVPGLKVIDGTNIQVIVGTEVQFVADAMNRIHSGAPAVVAAPVEKIEEVVVTGPVERDIYAVADGKLVSITEVSDDVFSQKMMGDGYAVLPTKGEIFTPISGTITNIFPTKHAMGILTDTGIEVLLHMGLDTVSLKGEPFELFVEEGQKVSRGQLIAKVDLEAIKKAGRKTDMIVVFTNADKVEKLTVKTGNVQANDVAGNVLNK
ncbi:PTS N-acetylglucosamine transporter subunit IIABC [Floricoccus penangensis]|uniref:PTS system sucrose-specific EIIBCA component n=1 Tax=Floricoccus penangensis TaxID=1859475 RepID=A0A9Q5JF07_9LACT|nr:N-acetylglucosamine-specific PTS transporter subunit IIBC [Floricoccus penangensis]OFI46099.1 PTS N-acetylglucosamine transporter subunit IIABC [Floricoccus penangensis]